MRKIIIIALIVFLLTAAFAVDYGRRPPPRFDRDLPKAHQTSDDIQLDFWGWIYEMWYNRTPPEYQPPYPAPQPEPVIPPYPYP